MVVSFRLAGTEVELFGQPLATAQQNGYRHLVVEARLLEAAGPAFRQQVIALKARGIKTEPTFAQMLALPGDSYQALLQLESADLPTLQKMLHAVGYPGR